LDFNDSTNEVIETIEEIEFELYNKIHPAFERIFMHDAKRSRNRRKALQAEAQMEYRLSRGE
jgi:hypothetical protein